MQKKGIVSLYIVQKGDTLESICKKLNITEEILIRYNPLLKTVNVHENMPLTIVSFAKEETFEIEEREKKKCVPNEKEFNSLLKEIAFYLKEGIASNTFYKDNIEPVTDELDKLYVDLSKFFKSLSNAEYRKKFIAFLKEYEKEYLSIVPLLQKKDPALIKKYQKNLNLITANFVAFLEEIESELNEKSVIETMKRLGETLQLFALKIITFRFKAAQNVFREILSQIDKLTTLIKI